MTGPLLFALALLQASPDTAAARRAEAASYGMSVAQYEQAQAAAAAAAIAAETAAAAFDAENRAASRWAPEEETPGQDIEWAATVAQANALLQIPTKAGLTGAQRDTCAQIADRIGSWQHQRAKHRSTQADAEALRVGMTDRDNDGERDATPALLDLISIITDDVVREGDRAGHALMSAHLVFCRP